MGDLKAKPFYLNDEDIKWVENTLAGMTEDEKIGQLFCLIAYGNDQEYLKRLTGRIDVPTDGGGGYGGCRPYPPDAFENSDADCRQLGEGR
jgi:beta-N-acetylhexosaminidase